ncbi:hypothetical protein NDU88_002233 [Pleurodeles waltl]|uniref:Uncharacterized protein n=1 Tax=Pleurodeles waltl TaxID=8319 RepID=A0AAV7UAS7_PLEWA|nr:hypothetical protein NDU88_002233 [Pleurodeles waltl]
MLRRGFLKCSHHQEGEQPPEEDESGARRRHHPGGRTSPTAVPRSQEPGGRTLPTVAPRSQEPGGRNAMKPATLWRAWPHHVWDGRGESLKQESASEKWWKEAPFTSVRIEDSKPKEKLTKAHKKENSRRYMMTSSSAEVLKTVLSIASQFRLSQKEDTTLKHAWNLARSPTTQSIPFTQVGMDLVGPLTRERDPRVGAASNSGNQENFLYTGRWASDIPWSLVSNGYGRLIGKENQSGLVLASD